MKTQNPYHYGRCGNKLRRDCTRELRKDRQLVSFAKVEYPIICSAEDRFQLDRTHTIMTFQRQQYSELRHGEGFDTYATKMETC